MINAAATAAASLPPMNAYTVEQAYSRGLVAQRKGDYAYAQKGMRAAHARDPRLLVALERGTEVLHSLAESQFGRSIRAGNLTHRPVWPTELTMWREAYVAADKGEPLPHLSWIYGMAADLAGL